MNTLSLLLLCAVAWIPPARADSFNLRAADSLGTTEIAAGRTREYVSNQPNDWTETNLEVLHRFGDRKLLIGRLTGTERFGLRDSTVSVAGYHPLGERTTLYAEAAASSTHRVLPRDVLHLQLSQILGGGWGAIGGLKQMRYDSTTVTIADLALEYYISSFRLALTALPAHSTTAGNASSFRLQLGHYYGEENNVQFVVATGEEVDRPVAFGSIIKTSVRSTAIYGRHWFARDWALTYNIGRTRQGESRRDAAGVGLRYRF